MIEIKITGENWAEIQEKLALIAPKAEPEKPVKASKKDVEKEEPAKVEPVKEEPVKEEPAKQEPVKEEPVKEEPAKEEPVKEEPAKEDSAEALHKELLDAARVLVASGKNAQLAAIFNKYGVRKIADIPADKKQAALADLTAARTEA